MKDPAFLFYPGDYLRDTQCLSEPCQVAYDRIMCEHMRNICISQAQLDFFTKRLTDDQKSELMLILAPCAGGFCIPWVVDSINKRREYSESRRKNRSSKKEFNPKDMRNTSTTYDSHMEIVNENENVIEFGLKKESRISIRKVYASDKVKIIYDLQAFFHSTGQADTFREKGWTRYEDFMTEFAPKVFDSDGHLFNAYRQFCTQTTKKGQTINIDDL